MSQTINEGKACAVLSYLLVGIIWFFADKKMSKNTYAKFHVKQAIIFMLLLLIVNLGISIISIISKTFGELVALVVYGILLILWLFAIIYAAAGKERGLPIFGPFAKLLDF